MVAQKRSEGAGVRAGLLSGCGSTSSTESTRLRVLLSRSRSAGCCGSSRARATNVSGVGPCGVILRLNSCAAADVEATPPGLARWDIRLYLFPFAAVGFLWLRAAIKGRSLR